MKLRKKVLGLLAICGTMGIGLSSCDSWNEGPLSELTPGAGSNAPADENLNRWVQSYFETRLAYVTSDDAQKTDVLRANLESFFDSKEGLKATLAKLDEEKAMYVAQGIVFLSSSVEAKVVPSGSQKVSDLLELEAVTLAITPITAVDSESGSPIVPEAFHTFDLSLTPSGNQWAIVSEVETTPWITGVEDSVGRGAQELIFEWDVEPGFVPGQGTVLKVEAYNFDRSKAAKWAKDHWSKALAEAVTGYYYFPVVGDNGGDCTNFLCWCLREGGWASTANWHYYGSGSSGNGNSYQRTPSWTSANRFNQYITNTGMYEGVNGDNRVEKAFGPLTVPTKSSWSKSNWATANAAFISAVKKLKKGAIVQISDGSSMVHSMIVTSTSTSSPWVYLTYHTTDTKEKPIINLTGGTKLYGYNTKDSGY